MSQLVEKNEQVKQLTAANDLLAGSIKTTNESLASLRTTVDGIKSDGKIIRSSLRDLEKSNENVKAYFASLVPVELVRMYTERKNSIRNVVPTK